MLALRLWSQEQPHINRQLPRDTTLIAIILIAGDASKYVILLCTAVT